MDTLCPQILLYNTLLNIQEQNAETEYSTRIYSTYMHLPMTAEWTKTNPFSNLIPYIELFHIEDMELQNPKHATMMNISIVPQHPDVYTYTIPDLPDHNIYISIENKGPHEVTVQQRCYPTHGDCLQTTKLSPHKKEILPLHPPANEKCAGFDIVNADPLKIDRHNNKQLLLVIRFESQANKKAQLRQLLHTLQTPNR